MNVITSQTWNATVTAFNSMTLTAPAGTQLNANNAYDLHINFGGAVNPDMFSFAALWSDSPNSNNTSVPEPTTLSLFGVAALALFAMRRCVFNAI